MASHQAPSLAPFLRVGVVGCGRVGATIGLAIDAGRVHADLAAVCDTNADRVQDLMFRLKRPSRSMSLRGLVASVDLVIEATNRHAAPAVIMAALDGGKDILVTNPAAILTRDDFPRLAYDRGLTIFATDTLLGGAAPLNAAAVTPEARVELVLTCPPRVLADAPFLRGRQLNPGAEPELVFQGEAGDALVAFPALANLVAAAMIGAGSASPLIRVRAHDVEGMTDIELTVSSDKHSSTAHVRARSAGAEPVHPEIIGTAAIAFLRSLVSSLRLA